MSEHLGVVSAIFALVATAGGFVWLGYRLVVSVNKTVSDSISTLKNDIMILNVDMDKKFDTIWKRFDQRKEFLDKKCSNAHKDFEKIFLRKDNYEDRHNHLQVVLEGKLDTYSKVTQEKIESMRGMFESIKAVIDELKKAIESLKNTQ